MPAALGVHEPLKTMGQDKKYSPPIFRKKRTGIELFQKHEVRNILGAVNALMWGVAQTAGIDFIFWFLVLRRAG